MNDPLLLVGQLLDAKYLIEAFVSEGGFAMVYRAEHVIWKKPVAIKLFSGLSSAPPEMHASLHEAFLQEGAFLSELCTETASIVQPRDVGTYTAKDGTWLPYMVLEWLEGQDLDQLLMRERAERAPTWTLVEAMGLLAQVATALDIAHGKGIAHRDVKPANLFLVAARSRAEIGTVKVLDFGVAKLMADASFKTLLVRTGANLTAYTPTYAAPEQFTRDLGATGPWTDVYSLAAIAVELLSGHGPRDSDDLSALGAIATNVTVRPTPRAHGVGVSDAVEAVFARALAVRPEDRYTRAGELWRDLEAASGLYRTGTPRDRASRLGFTPVSARPSALGSAPPSVSATLPPARRTRTLKARLGVGAAALAIGLIGTLALLVSSRTADHRGKEAPNNVAASRLSATPLPPPPECPANTVKIPAGQFFMGSELKDAPEDEKPSHNVTLDAFCMDLYEVTASQYKACADVGKCKRAPKEVAWPKITEADRKLYSPWCTFGDPDKANHPINCVTWEMADNYCAVNGQRLPTEAEWEYATRGPDGRVYPWGDEAPTAQHLNACGTECGAWGKKHDAPLSTLYAEDDGYVATAPVGSFPKGRSRFGPYDVAGNVWEWTSTWFGPYSAEKVTNPRGPDHGERRVIRGGAFNGGYASWLRPSFRYGQVPEAQSHGIGFRCAGNVAKP